MKKLRQEALQDVADISMGCPTHGKAYLLLHCNSAGVIYSKEY
jgi:hypothetical protein